MIAFASCIGSPETYARHARRSIAALGGDDALVAEIETDAICSGYNEALDAFSGNEALEALVLLHEDLEIMDPELCEKLRRRLADPDVAVIGAIGAREVRSLCWWEGRPFGRIAETRGQIDHGGGCHDVEAVDGCFMALSPWAVRNLRFDERYGGFHGYDVDLCLEARAAGRRVLVDQLSLHHHTRGGLGDERAFWEADATLRAKWRRRGLPMMSDAERAGRRSTFVVADRPVGAAR